MVPPQFTQAELIETTLILQNAVESGKLDSIDLALIGAFNLHSELKRHLALLDDHRVPAVKAEILILEGYLGRVMLFLKQSGRSFESIAEMLFKAGALDTQGEVFRIAAFIHDMIDRERFQGRSVPMIGIVGPIAGGKGTIGDLLQAEFGFRHYPLSPRLKEVAMAQGALPPFDREFLREIDGILKPRFGSSVFVRWTIEMAKRQVALDETVMGFSLDGFRSEIEGQEFIEAGGVLIGVTASPETCFQRAVVRNRQDLNDINREKFFRDDAVERAWIDPILNKAEIVIVNEGTPEEFLSQARSFLKRKLVIA